MSRWIDYPEHRTLKFFPLFYQGLFAFLTASLELSHVRDEILLLVKPTNETSTFTGLVKSAENLGEQVGIEPWLLVTILIGEFVNSFFG